MSLKTVQDWQNFLTDTMKPSPSKAGHEHRAIWWDPESESLYAISDPQPLKPSLCFLDGARGIGYLWAHPQIELSSIKKNESLKRCSIPLIVKTRYNSSPIRWTKKKTVDDTQWTFLFLTKESVWGYSFVEGNFALAIQIRNVHALWANNPLLQINLYKCVTNPKRGRQQFPALCTGTEAISTSRARACILPPCIWACPVTGVNQQNVAEVTFWNPVPRCEKPKPSVETT